MLDIGGKGGVVGVRSIGVDVNSSSTSAPLAERRFGMGKWEISIWEETGESIARHIWYGRSRYVLPSLPLTDVLQGSGFVLSAWISQLPSPSPNIPRLPHLETLLSKDKEKNLKALELGSGCGIVGITLSHLLPSSTILLTDLPEASEILPRNLSSSSPKSKNISHLV